MNLFSSFTFGRLIKTFIPGFIILISFIILIDVISLWFHQGIPILNFGNVAQHGAEAIAICIAMCILLGLLLNTVVFAGISTALIRNPVEKNHPDLFAAKKEIERQIKYKCINDIKDHLKDDKNHADTLIAEADAEYIAIHALDATKLVYIQEQYWYYMELQINLALSIVIMLAAFILREGCINGFLTPGILPRDIAATATTGALFFFLVSVARKNYRKHSIKMLSLLSSYFREMLDETASKREKTFPVCPARGGELRSS